MVTLGGMSGVNLTFGLQNGHSGGNEWCKPYFWTTEWSLWGE